MVRLAVFLSGSSGRGQRRLRKLPASFSDEAVAQLRWRCFRESYARRKFISLASTSHLHVPSDDFAISCLLLAQVRRGNCTFVEKAAASVGDMNCEELVVVTPTLDLLAIWRLLLRKKQAQLGVAASVGSACHLDESKALLVFWWPSTPIGWPQSV